MRFGICSLLLCACALPPPLPQEKEPSLEEMLERMDSRAAPIKDIRFDYTTRTPMSDPGSGGLDWHVRLFYRADTGLRIETYRPRVREAGQTIPALRARYVYTADRLLCAFGAPKVAPEEDGLPLTMMQFGIRYADPDFQRIDPFLLPLEYPARIFFDDPLIVATVAPRRILSLEHKPRILGKRVVDGRTCWVLETHHSLEAFARLRGSARFGAAASDRLWFIDAETWRIARLEYTFTMNRRGDSRPLLSSRVVDWQEIAGVALPKNVEIGYGDREKDGSIHLDRKLTKRLEGLAANRDLPAERVLPVWEKDDVYADALLRRPAFYDSRARKDPAANYAWLISTLAGAEAWGGLGFGRNRTFVQPGVKPERLLKALSARPDSAAIQLALLGALEEEKSEELEETAKELKNPPPPVALRIAARFPKLDVKVDESALDEEEECIAVGIRMARDPKAFDEALKSRDFRSRITLVEVLGDRFEGLSFPGDSPFARYGEARRAEEAGKTAEALRALAAEAETSPEAGEFVLNELRGLIASLGKEELKDLSERVLAILQTLSAARAGDPLTAAVRAQWARRNGLDAKEGFERALETSRTLGPDSSYVSGVFRALSDAAVFFSETGDEKRLAESGELFLKLAGTVGRPAQELVNDARRSPVLLLTRLYCDGGKFAELYRSLRGVDWNLHRYSTGVLAILQTRRVLDRFIEAAKKECLSGSDVKEWIGLARFIAKPLGKPLEALDLLEKARAREPKNGEILRLEGETAAKAKQYALAVEVYDALAEAVPGEAAIARISIAEIEIARQMPEAALETLGKLDLQTLDGESAERAGKLFRTAGDLKRALQAYLRADAEDRSVHLPLGRLYETSGDVVEAMRRYNRAIAAGEDESTVRPVPGQKTSAEEAKRLLYETLGHDFFLDRFFKEKLDPLADSESKRARELVEKLSGEAVDEREDALDGLRAIGPRAAPLLKDRSDDPGVRALLLEWAEPH